MKSGLLLINLGTPESTQKKEIQRYLQEFLTDKRIITLPAVLRYALVYGFIVPFRIRKTIHAYKAIWTEQGSPLLAHHQDLVKLLKQKIGKNYQISLGMRYGKPSILEALQELKDCDTIWVLPLFPQYSSAATGSALEKVLQILAKQENIPSLQVISHFYQHPAYIRAQAKVIQAHLHTSEHLLLSYHGIPEQQILKSGCTTVCKGICPPVSVNNYFCYKAQCHQTSQLLAAELKLSPSQYSTSFQSRLGKLAWIKPYTDEVLTQLAAQGIQNLAVVCPSFVVDCLETLEEIGLRAKKQWQALGGKSFKLIPALNIEEQWVQAILSIIGFKAE